MYHFIQHDHTTYQTLLVSSHAGPFHPMNHSIQNSFGTTNQTLQGLVPRGVKRQKEADRVGPTQAGTISQSAGMPA
jgi:hypothetical protein